MIASNSFLECISCPHSILDFIEFIRSVNDCLLWLLHAFIYVLPQGIGFWFCWDVLSSECKLEVRASISTGREPTNLVSTVLVEHEQKRRVPICYLEDSHTDAIGNYMVYAPIDIPTINAITVGTGNPDAVAILASGFAVLADEPNEGEEGNEDWSILTIMLQMIDQNASTDFIPPESVATFYNVITSAARRIQARFAPS